jgi:hypothetical protein
MQFKVKVVEATSPYDLEKNINEALKDPEYKDYEVYDVKYVVTLMPGAKVSRGGMFYMASILFRRD